MKNYCLLILSLFFFASCENEKIQYNQEQIKNELKNDLNFEKYMEGEVYYLFTMDKIIQHEPNIKTAKEIYEGFSDADLDYFNSVAKKYNLSRSHKDLKELIFNNVTQKFDVEIIELETLLRELFRNYLDEFLSSKSALSHRTYDPWNVFKERLDNACENYCAAETDKYGNDIEDPVQRRGYKAAFETGCLKGCSR